MFKNTWKEKSVNLKAQSVILNVHQNVSEEYSTQSCAGMKDNAFLVVYIHLKMMLTVEMMSL